MREDKPNDHSGALFRENSLAVFKYLGISRTMGRLLINTTNITMLHMIAAIAIDIDIIILMVSISTMNVSMLDDGSHCTRGLLPVMGRFFPPR